jgi:hypothetical protein
MEPETPPRPRQALAVACALGAAAFSVLPFLAGFFWGVAGQCDESCDSGSSDWRHVSGAWQWNVLPILGGAVFVAGICLVVFVRRRRAGAAGLSFVAALACLVALAAWSGVGVHDDLGRLGMHRFLLLVGPLFLGAMAVLLTDSREETEPYGG